MAKPSLALVAILRRTAQALEKTLDYQWGHMGACNCGFLAQQVTALKKEDIHARAMQGTGDWSEQLNDYCATSGLLMDDLITQLLEAGFSTSDLRNLEYLSDPAVLGQLPLSERHLKHNVKHDVIKYLYTWADLMESRLLEMLPLPDLTTLTYQQSEAE